MSNNKKKINPFFDSIVGQEEAKSQLNFIARTANVNMGYCPPTLIIGPKGIGKTMFAKAFGKTLTTAEGQSRPVVTINSSTVKSVANFLTNIYPKILKLGKACCIFFDESHALDKGVQTMFLSILNPEKGMLRTIEHNGNPVDFDLKELAFLFATTDPQLMIKPLVDRLGDPVALRDYDAGELGEILNIHLPDIKVDPLVLPLITPTLRGNGRSAVQRASQIQGYCLINDQDTFGKKDWEALKKQANIKPLGMNVNEIQVLRILNNRGPSTLQTLIAASGQSQSMLRMHLEPTLVRLGLMKIEGTRQITPDGIEILREIDG